MNKNFHAIGLMSGTSLDGLDMVEVVFNLQEDGGWSYQLLSSAFFSYPNPLLERLKKAVTLPAEELMELSSELGRFYAEKVNIFLHKNKIEKSTIDFIASHGQTVFHQPRKGYTLQIGNGPELAVNTQLPTIVDFRSKDVAYGGNGAPLIPVADFQLFSSFADSFLNLGGFSNLSFKRKKEVQSFDICPVNIVINHLVGKKGKSLDKNGDLGRKGRINKALLERLNQIEFYQIEGPKSLGWEWVEKQILPFFKEEIKWEDQLRTFYEHIACQMGKALDNSEVESCWVTGGGAKNHFLIERIKEKTTVEIKIPKEEIIDYKEAIGFAFLGVLRWTHSTNIWGSVTGAKKDSCSGEIILP